MSRPRSMVGRRGFAAACFSIAAVAVVSSAGAARGEEPVRILLLGDSTVEGSVCRKVAPHADHLEGVIRKRLAAIPGVPKTEVVNEGRDGEYIQRLLQNRYDAAVKAHGRFDFVMIRYGINDRAKREGFAENFPKDYHELIARIRQDNPGVRIILETTIPYANPKAEEEINSLVKKVAEEEKLPLLDTHERFAEALKKSGPNTLTYHRVKLAVVPEELQSLIPPEATKVIRNEVVVMDNLLDAHFEKVPGWFGDRHPNMAGYHVLGRSAAEFLAPRLMSGK